MHKSYLFALYESELCAQSHSAYRGISYGGTLGRIDPSHFDISQWTYGA